MRLVVFAVLAGCAPRSSLPADDPTPDRVRHYTIWLGGARVGTAVEREVWSKAGVELTREERLRFLRGDAEIELATAIAIDADRDLVAHHVRWTERGAEIHSALATRDRDGWRLSTGAQLARTAVPAELVPLLVRRDGAFAGTVFLPARGFVAGTGRIDPVAPGRLVARLVLDAGPIVEATIDLDRDGAPARVVDGEGVIAIRASEAQAGEPFRAVDLIAATAIAIGGTHRTNRLVLDANVALPALPGQLVRAARDGFYVELDASLAGALPAGPSQRDRTTEIRALVSAVRRRITPDLGVPASARDAATATAGDCTTFALAYAALASGRAIPTRVVTGLRVDRVRTPCLGEAGACDRDRLVRHRWAVSWTGARWIAIDAAYGAVPAGGNLIGLAVHDADDTGLVAGEAALAHVHAARWVE